MAEDAIERELLIRIRAVKNLGALQLRVGYSSDG